MTLAVPDDERAHERAHIVQLRGCRGNEHLH